MIAVNWEGALWLEARYDRAIHLETFLDVEAEKHRSAWEKWFRAHYEHVRSGDGPSPPLVAPEYWNMRHELEELMGDVHVRPLFELIDADEYANGARWPEPYAGDDLGDE